MKTRAYFLLSIAVLVTAGCSSLPLSPLPSPDTSNRAEVLIYRAYAFNAGGVSLSVGIDGAAFAILGNSEYVTAWVAAGKHQVFVQARSADPTTLTVDPRPRERVCLKTEADPSNLGKVLLPPLLIASGYRFTLERTSCPTEAELAKNSRVSVEYR